MLQSRKFIFLYAFLTSLTALSIDTLLPALPVIEQDLAGSKKLSGSHIVTLFVFGMVLGELLAGPLSDALGRKPILILGLFLYGIGTIICWSSGSLATLALGRIIQGVGISGPKIVTRAIIRDQSSGDEMASVMSLLLSIFIVVPILAPMIGLVILTSAGWRAIFCLYLCVAVILGLWFALHHPETLTASKRQPFRIGKLFGLIGKVFAINDVVVITLAIGLVYGAQLLFLSISADLFLRIYNISESFPIYFSFIAMCFGFAAYANSLFVKKFGVKAMGRFGCTLYFFCTLVLFMLTTSSEQAPPLSLFVCLCGVIFGSVALFFGNYNALALEPLGANAGTGSAVVSATASLIATFYAFFFTSLYDGTLTFMSWGFIVSASLVWYLTSRPN